MHASHIYKDTAENKKSNLKTCLSESRDLDQTSVKDDEFNELKILLLYLTFYLPSPGIVLLKIKSFTLQLVCVLTADL